MERTLLIVDDIKSNREILKNILGKEYRLLEAKHGQEALELMEKRHRDISAILLDLGMPVMDGYAVLEYMRGSETLSQLPVIVTTGQTDAGAEERALKLGAMDYITKPYKATIIKQRIWNTINLRESAATVNALQRDRLTGLYSRDAFFERVQIMVRAHEPCHYIIACFDVQKFKIINDQYGTGKGDEVLKHIAETFKAGFAPNGGICCRIAADNFAVLYPAAFKDSEVLADMRREAGTIAGLASPLAFSIGRYCIDRTDLAPSAMYDRAVLAANSIKGRYDSVIANYSESMRQELIEEQEIVTEMDAALQERQFEVWFQPQYNHSTGSIIGAEALVRWRHPQKGLIPPAKFVPVFEKNGFVYAMDTYILEEVCRFLRSELDAEADPLPVSVNISRYDMFREGFVGRVTGFTDEYRIPKELLRLEVTESAFANSTERIVEVVKELVGLGFTIEIDDFGNGYSSLNTLKSVPAQVVKLDMGFFASDGKDDQRSGNIIESVVRMTKWLDMAVIAEGVETVEQADFLRSIGCSYVQGYLYAKPMPEEDYRRLTKGGKKEAELRFMKTVKNLDNNAFWSPESLDTLIFNSYVGAACIFEYRRGTIELVRVSEKYIQVLGGGENMTVEEVLKLDWMEHLDEKDRKKMRECIEESLRIQGEVSGEFLFCGLPHCQPLTYLRSTMRVIATADDRCLVYCTNENISAQREAEAQERALAEQLKELLDNMPCGAALYELNGGEVSAVHRNKRYFELVSRKDDGTYNKDVLGAIYPEDRAGIARELDAAIRERRDLECDLRLLYGESEYRPFHVSGRILRKGKGKYAVYAAYTPISDDKMSAQEMLAFSLSAMMESMGDYFFVKDKNLRYVCASRRVEMMANAAAPAEMVGRDDYDYFSEAMADAFRKDDLYILSSGESLVDNIDMLPSTDGTPRYACTSKYPLRDSRGKVIGVYGIGHDVTETLKMESQLELLTNNIPGGIAIYQGCTDALDHIKLSYFSDGYCRLFGYDRDEYAELAKNDPMGQVLPADMPRLRAGIKALAQKGEGLDCIFRARAKDGSQKWINIKAVTGESNGNKVSVNAVLFDVSEHQEALEQLRISEEENRLALQHTSNAVCRFDVATRSITVPKRAQKTYLLPERIPGLPEAPIENGEISPETAEDYRAFYQAIINGEKTGSAVYQRKAASGWRWLEAHFSTIFSDSGEAVSAVVSFGDITVQREKDAAYARWQQSFINRDPATYSMFRCNLSKQTTSDTRSGELLKIEFGEGGFLFDEHTKQYAQALVCDEDRARFSAFLNVDNLLAAFYKGKRASSLEYRERKKDGDHRWLRLTVDMVEQGHQSEIEAYMLFEDIDREKRQALTTIEMAETDPLTGVLNRTTFVAKVNGILRGSQPDAVHALMMVDIDGFKNVNDAFGHGAGDQTLIDMSASVRSALRHGDLMGRLGGDEFLIFLSDIPEELVAANKARQICALMRKSFSAEVEISGSVGIAIAPRDGADFDTLYKKVDAALYHVKGSGKDNFAFFHDDMSGEHLTAADKGYEALPAVSAKKKRRMLIVGDSRIDQAFLTNVFTEEFLVEKAQDGNAAMIRLRHYGGAVSVVLLDLRTPGMNGFEVLKRMRESAELRSIPVVVISGDENEETGLQVISSGATDYVTKPVDPEMLKIRVKAAVSKAENERQRAKNSFLEFQSGEVTRYKAALERSGIVLVENDWIAGTFSYDPFISKYIAGKFDSRSFWQILLSDFVAETKTVQKMQTLTHEVASDRASRSEQLLVKMKTPSGSRHWFKMTVYKLLNEFGIAGRVYLCFLDMGPDRPNT